MTVNRLLNARQSDNNLFRPKFENKSGGGNSSEQSGSASLLGEYGLTGFSQKARLIKADGANPSVSRQPENSPTTSTAPVQKITDSSDVSPNSLNFEESKSISDIAYEGNKGDVYQFPDGTYWRVDRAEAKDSGFRAVVMRRVVSDGSGGYKDDPSDNRVAIGFAGTNGGDDVDDDILQGIGFTPEQYDQAVAFTKEVQQEAAKNCEPVIATGHSLGGGLASYVAIQNGIQATAINSAPLSNNKVPDDVDYSGRITQYYAEGEILTDLDNANGYDQRPGKQVEVSAAEEEPSWYEYIYDPGGSIGRELQTSIDNHSLGNTAPEVPAPKKVYP